MMEIEVTPKTILKYLSSIVLLLVVINSVFLFFKFYFDNYYAHRLYPLFDLSHEKNIPTLYSSISLVICSILLLIIASKHKIQKNSYMHWLGLAMIFVFLAVDETASLHEKLIDPVKEILNTPGALYYAWVIPYAAALILMLVLYFNFIKNLPKNIMVLFLLSGFIFLLGAIGFETLSGWHYSISGSYDITYCILYTIEEAFEMFGIAIFIYALLSYITDEFNCLLVAVKKL